MSNPREILRIHVTITTIHEIHGHTGQAAMILFDGYADCEAFKGRIMSGGVDTQLEWRGEPRTLSARYMLEGVDAAGEKCRLFIENQAVIVEGAGELRTKPKIMTDSEELAWLETADLTGTVVPNPEGGVVVHIYS